MEGAVRGLVAWLTCLAHPARGGGLPVHAEGPACEARNGGSAECRANAWGGSQTRRMGDITVPSRLDRSISSAVSAFAAIGPNVPMKIRVKPTVAPFITAEPGPNGAMAELALANLLIEFLLPTHVEGTIYALSLINI